MRQFLPFTATEYVESLYPNQEQFSVSEICKAFNDGKKANSWNTCANWVPKNNPPRTITNQYVFILSFSPEYGVDVSKVLTTEFKDFIEAHDDALYWCYEYRIAPKKIRQQFQEIKDMNLR